MQQMADKFSDMVQAVIIEKQKSLILIRHCPWNLTKNNWQLCSVVLQVACTNLFIGKISPRLIEAEEED